MANCICKSRDLFNFGCRCTQLRVWYNGEHWIVAYSEQEAKHLAPWHDTRRYVILEDHIKITVYEDGAVGASTTLTAQEWVNEVGKSELLTTEMF